MKRKKALLLFVSTWFILALAVSPLMGACAKPAPAPAPAPALEKFEWKMQFAWPITTATARNLPFIEDVEKMSGGRIKIEPHYSGEIVPNNDIVDAVRDGILDLGHTWPNKIGDRKPGAYAIHPLPFGWRTPQEGSIFTHKPEVLELAREMFGELGVYYLGPLMGTDAKITSTSPIRSLDDMRELIIRAPGAGGKLLKKLGVSTTTVASPELYGALEKGMVDGIVYGAAHYGVSLGFFEVAKYHLDNFATSQPNQSCYVINLDLWHSLPEDIQAILIAATEANCRHISDLVTEEEIKARQIAREEMGVEFTYLPDEDLAEVFKAAMELWDEECGSESERAAQLVEMLREWNVVLGR